MRACLNGPDNLARARISGLEKAESRRGMGAIKQWLRRHIVFEKNVSVLCWTLFGILLSIYSWFLVLPLHLEELGASKLFIGAAYTLFAASFNIFQVFGGRLSDILGARNSIVWPSFLSGAVYLAMSFSSTPLSIISLMTLTNIFSAIQWPAMLALLTSSVPVGERGKVFGSLELFIGLGVAIGPAVGWLLLDRVGLSNMILACALMHFAMATVRLLYLKDVVLPTEEVLKDGIFIQAKRMFARPGMKLMAFTAIFYAITINITFWGPFVQLAAEEVFRLGKNDVNILFSFGGLIAVCFSPIFGLNIDRRGARTVFLFTLAMHVIFMLGWLFSLKGIIWLVLFVFSNVAFQASVIAFETLMAASAEGSSRGFIFGMLGTLQGIGASIGPIFGGYLAREFGIFWTFTFFTMASCVAIMTAFAGRGKPSTGK